MENNIFESQKKEWLRIPIDDTGYFSVKDLMNYSDRELKDLAERFEKIRYDLNGWRNFENKWRSTLGLDTTTGKHILDYGCGFGIEALQYAKKGNKVSIADLNPEGLDVATRVLGLFGFKPENKFVIQENSPFVETVDKFDVFHSNGVIHHIPNASEIIERAWDLLKDDGEVRMMLYSDKGRDIAEKRGEDFVRFFDDVGNYADWYDRDKIERTFGDNITVFDYITTDDRYLTVTIKK